MDHPEDEEILKWLERDEAASRPSRVGRMRILLDLFGENKDMLFYGGLVPVQAFEEMRLAFLNGLYISSVVTSQIVVEHVLSGLLDLQSGIDMHSAGFQELTREALASRFISQEEFEELNQLRKLRNPYSHSQPIMHHASIIRRAAECGTDPHELFKQDAEKALRIVANLLSRYPFTLADEKDSNEAAGGNSDAPPNATA